MHPHSYEHDHNKNDQNEDQAAHKFFDNLTAMDEQRHSMFNGRSGDSQIPRKLRNRKAL